MRSALDTNILAYAEGVNGAVLQQSALKLIARLDPHEVVLPVQVLGELFNVLTRKAGLSSAAARAIILSWRDTFSPIDTSEAVMLSATELAVDHRLGIWDSVILAAAAAAGCRLLLSQDLQDGFTWSGVTVANPFAAVRHPLLDTLMR